MKNVLLVLFFVAVAFARPKWHELDDNYSFEQYMHDFGKSYTAGEKASRSELFYTRLGDILDHNSLAGETYKKGVNQFTDWTQAEREAVNGLAKGLLYTEDHSAALPSRDYSGVKIQASVDWRQAGIISAVKDQGGCGSCWTFGTTETVESYLCLFNGMLTDLSEEQILDCTPNPNHCGGTGGCGGGTPVLAMQQLISMGGQTTEWKYPYTSYTGPAQSPPCHFNINVTAPLATLTGYTLLPPNEETQILAHLSSTGPLVINVDASSWFEYEAGVYNGCNQTHPDIDHVVQLVGYGTDPQYGQYWLVRNSWSPTWGELGYIRLYRSNKLQCGVDIHPQDGSGCTNGPKDVKVCGTCGMSFHVAYPNVELF